MKQKLAIPVFFTLMVVTVNGGILLAKPQPAKRSPIAWVSQVKGRAKLMRDGEVKWEDLKKPYPPLFKGDKLKVIQGSVVMIKCASPEETMELNSVNTGSAGWSVANYCSPSPQSPSNTDA